jgi:hypothetical protein
VVKPGCEVAVTEVVVVTTADENFEDSAEEDEVDE